MNRSSKPEQPDFWTEIAANKSQLLSVIGIIASIMALGWVILDKIAASQELPSTIASWRLVLMVTALFCMGAITLLTYYAAHRAYSDDSISRERRVWAIAWRTVLGLLFFGIFLDGLFSAVYWTPWLYGLLLFLRQAAGAFGII
jgi:hypothetical protein